MTWRRSVENKFKFNSNAPIDPIDIADVHSKIATRRKTLETELIKGIRHLETARVEALAKRTKVKGYEPTYLAFRQAEADANAL